MQQTIFFAEIQNKMILSKKDELGKHDAYIQKNIHMYKEGACPEGHNNSKHFTLDEV